MRILDWFRALHIRESHIRQQWNVIRELSERQQRLEIRQRTLEENQAYLDDSHERLRGRLDGARGGRPRKATAPVSVADVPLGDKAALRKALGVFPLKPKE